MASIQVPVSDEKLLALLAESRGLDVGKGRVSAIDVVAQPPVSNSNVSHHVSVTIEFGLELGEVETLVGY
ncbi:hypothetical protein [Microbacterium sp. NPDC077184]|uniref:hypothetical protein n=1 Tax=Microbacterium sp. NPDC077184 TaxID=3154764 RepID=UPI0034129EA2